MRKILCAVVLLLSVLPLKGQTITDDEYLGNRWINEWQSAFSADGRRSWKPEITARAKVGIYTGGQNLSIGARVDDKRTLGLMLGNGHLYVDAAPGDVYAIQTSAYMRRYLHLGKRDIIALYSDLALGASWVYKVSGKYWYDDRTGEIIQEMISANPGDVHFMATWEPGIRLRFYRNIHLFLGPTISTDCLGLHIGLGL